MHCTSDIRATRIVVILIIVVTLTETKDLEYKISRNRLEWVLNHVYPCCF